MRTLMLCLMGWMFGGVDLGVADEIRSVRTYREAYGATKGELKVDPGKELGRYPAVEPKEAVGTFKVKDGFRMELVAHEPGVRSPIAMSFDERGRMFVCEMIDYSEQRDEKPHLGRVSMLEDRDGDGFYESSRVFADDLPWPTGVIAAMGGIYVVATPNIWFLKDTDGDGRADVREKVFAGIGVGLKILNVQALANCPQWGPDNRIHVQSGNGNRGKLKCLKRPDLPELEIAGHDFWFDPLTYEFGLEPGGGQYGMSYDDFGRRFVCNNSDHLRFYVYDGRYAARNPFYKMPGSLASIAADGGAAEVFRISPDEPWRILRTRWRVSGVVPGAMEGGGRVSGYFTGATGTTVYRGDAYGSEFVNNTFTGDAGGALIHRKVITEDGVSLVGRRPVDETGVEFAASTDTWVRMVNFANAPDGCLYACDMYREVIEHPWSIPDEIKKHLDLTSGRDRGRLWRVAPVRGEWTRRANVDVGRLGMSELVEMLEHENGWHRDTASRLIYERQDRTAVPLLERMVRVSQSEVARLHALSALDGLRALSAEVLLKAMKDGSEHVRERALRLAEESEGEDLIGVVERVVVALRDEKPRVRMQAAFTLAEVGGEMVHAREMAKLLVADFEDDWVRSAVLSARPAQVAKILVEFEDGEVDGGALVMADLIRIVAAWADEARQVELVELVASRWADAEVIGALSEGLKHAGTSLFERDQGGSLAGVFGRAAEVVMDESVGEKERVGAVGLLGADGFERSGEVLGRCLTKGRPVALQVAAMRALGRYVDAEVAEMILREWQGYDVVGRAAAVGVLLERPEWVRVLLETMKDGESGLKAGMLSASQVQGLIGQRDETLAALAREVLAEVIPPSRVSVLAKFQGALDLKGDGVKGREVFVQRCFACHRADGLGVLVGPDLVTVKGRGRAGLMEAILDPAREVAPQYVGYVVETKEGQTLTGVIKEDGASGMTLLLMGGAEVVIPRSEVRRVSAAGSSFMPEGLEAGMSEQEMADLLTFIEGLR